MHFWGLNEGAKGAENDQNSKLTDFSQNWFLGYFIGAEFEYGHIFSKYFGFTGVSLGAKGAENDQNSKLTDFSQNFAFTQM